MKEYSFVLNFDLRDSDSDPADYVERLGESGCTDALIGLGKKGYIALDFAREAESGIEAITSAIQDVKKAIPQAVLVEASPDYVGLTDIAQALGFTRQNARKLLVDGDYSPPPVHQGNPSLWRFAEVLTWLKEKGYSFDSSLLEVASVNMELNVYKGMTGINESRKEMLVSLI